MDNPVNKAKKIYFVGIKGVAMATLALWAKQAGKMVSGSDVEEEFPTDETLKKAGIRVYNGFDKAHIKTSRPDMVIYTGAHGGNDNIEVGQAVSDGIPAYPHGQALGLVMEGKRQVSVAGSHGKTTTAAMIATIFSGAGWDPSYAVGCGTIGGLGFPGHCGGGDIFVAEADEYVTDPGKDLTPRFLWQNPDVVAVTNIDFDHPDVYKDLKAVQEAFLLLQNQQKGSGITIVNADDRASRVLLQGPHVVTYGESPDAQYRISHVGFGEGRTFFTLTHRLVTVGEFSLKVPGRHNALNAAAASVLCQEMGVSWDEIRRGLLAFEGTKRRFEKIAEGAGIVYYDDYAHHPREIEATVQAARVWYPGRRIVCVFEPHTFSRTKALLDAFARALTKADIAIVADIYASAREHDSLGITAQTLVGRAVGCGANASYGGTPQAIGEQLRTILRPGDVVLFMGAGNIYVWGRDVVRMLGRGKTP